ncbi:hypothetical protein D3C84_779930 [compost metagenome]
MEGLSIIAITYYLLSLLKLGYSGLHLLGVDVAPREAMLAMTPLAIGILALIVLRIKKVKGH